MTTLSSIIAWRIPWTVEPGRLQSMGLQRIGHNWVHVHTCARAHTHKLTHPTLPPGNWWGISSVQFSHWVMSESLQPHGLQHARMPCPSSTPRAYSNSCPLSRWCHPVISSFVVPFSSCLQSFTASGSFPVKQFFTSSGQSIGVLSSALVLPVNIQGWFLWRWIGWISLQSRRLSRVFSNTTFQKNQFFSSQLSL